ncbi:hypothetical protein DID88_005004 [Monilinia fructigena]|uniref:AAA+ ATPase domain-containing protein n=1 Tax=Monilinia fructigena TaxID=38457 RepID=A0A395IS73_9HELO|nr:hypothetical protein DID88_005004 [Monilinia fructigena]
MENTDVASSDKARNLEHYLEMDRVPATQNDIPQHDSNPSEKAMDRQREAQEYIRNRRAQATVAGEANENVMADNVAQFGPQNTSRESEDDEQKLLVTLAEKYNYNLYLPPGNSGSPVIEHTNYAAQLHRTHPSNTSQTHQITDGHDSWHHSRPRNRSGSPPAEDPPRSPSPSIRQLDSTQITPSPPPPIPTAPISDFLPGPTFSTSHMPYQANNSRPTYMTNLRQYADRNRMPVSKQTPERSEFENNTANPGTQPSVASQLSDRYRHNQIVSTQNQKSQSPQTAPTQWAAPKPARNNANIVQNLQDSQAIQLSESGSQHPGFTPRPILLSRGKMLLNKVLSRGMIPHTLTAPKSGAIIIGSRKRITQLLTVYQAIVDIKCLMRRRTMLTVALKLLVMCPPGQIAPIQQSHHGHEPETYGPHHEHDLGPGYGYDQNSQGESALQLQFLINQISHQNLMEIPLGAVREDTVRSISSKWIVVGHKFPGLCHHPAFVDVYTKVTPAVKAGPTKRRKRTQQSQDLETPISWYQMMRNELAEFLEGESVCLVGSELSAGLKRLTRQNIQENPYYPSFNVGTEFPAPYPWFYHQRAPLEERRRQLKPELLARVNSFVEYVNDSFGPEYAVVDALLSQGKISRKYLCYLYSPETVILRTEKGDEGKKAYLTKSWLDLPAGGSLKGSGEADGLTTSLLVSSWTFDGLFQENVESITIDDFKMSEEVLKITALSTYPMRYADPAIGTSLRKQGEMFWKFRKPCYIYYSEQDESEENIGQSRYMIDVKTYKKLHSKSKGIDSPNRDDLGSLAMASDAPPEGVFTLLLPNKIVGFNMSEKKWVDLEVSRMYLVKWNKDAFESLARDNDTKILIKSLVANQIKDEQIPGLIGRKGSGSAILLHGPPGTGKTMTAESVAEVVKKPLYVTSCSELGTTTETLEKSLEQILYFGRVWKCVILLEEAEMFLEKRTLGDLHRNALISVFLRSLESYNGIIILTSSPIAAIDEVLKSRIQLSLRYTPLNLAQRTKIWEVHIAHLESLESLFNPSTINISELRANLPALAKYKLNGHEIGHAVRTARQLAVWKGIPMGFEEVQYAVGVAGRFNDLDEEVKKNAGEAVKGVVEDADDDPYDGVEDLMSVAGL